MKVFVAILALVGAAAATAIPESVEARLMEAHQNQAIMNAERAIHIDEMRSFSVFGAPKLSREVILPTERFGVKGLHDKPMILAVKKFDKNEVVGFLLKHGLKSIFEEPELVNLRKAVLSGPAKMGLMLSAARYLDIPEMSLPMKEILVPGEATLTTAFRISQEYPTMPWMFVTEKDNLRLGSLDKLVELGEFNVFHDKVVLVRDFMPNIMEIPVGVAAARDLELENLNLYPGQRTSLRSLIPLEDTAAFENVERIYPNQRLISTYPYRVPAGQYYTRNQPLRTLSSVNPITINPYSERLSGLGSYSSIPSNVPLVQIY